MKNRICAFLVFLTLQSTAAFDYKDLPGERFPEWNAASVTFPDADWDTVDVTTLGINPGNALSDSISRKFMDILEAKGSDKRVYYFPEGTYTFEQPVLIGPDGYKSNWNATGVDVNNFVVMGAGPDKTRFLFDCDVTYFKALFWVEKPGGYYARNNPVNCTSVPMTGDNQVILSDASKASAGDFISIKSDNDPLLMFPEGDAEEAWYIKYIENGYEEEFAESYGQISRITAVNGNTVSLSPPIGIDFRSELNPRATIYEPKRRNEFIGIQDLYIEHVIDSSRYSPGGTNDVFNIAFRFASDCFVKNVESFRTARGHVIVEYAHNVLITGSKFSYSRKYGVGGAGYGVCIQNRSSLVTVENNEFEHLRHSVVLKEGANHCVIAYNWSHDWAILDPEVTDEQGNRIEAEADISIHGLYSHNNLFEGNVCHNIFYADYWGPTGPRTTAFRNFTYGTDTLSGIFVDDYSHRENVIANVLPGQSRLYIDPSCEQSLSEGNVVNGNVQWNTLALSSSLPASLYLEGPPDFWKYDIPFPAFGPDVENAEQNVIPVNRSEHNTVIRRPIEPTERNRTSIYWNAGSRLLKIVSRAGQTDPVTVDLVNCNGKVVSNLYRGVLKSMTIPIGAEVPSGMYQVIIRGKRNATGSKLM
ncbi:MAG: hypothetical protein ACLFVQ_13060, partial [Chitinispirillaceae bacterium]